MRAKPQSVLIRWLFCLLFLTLLLPGVVLAQSSAPLADLNIALWPEYDRPEVLVIFRGRVADNTPLPAALTFKLPATTETLHAIAYVDEGQGTLLNIEEYDFTEGADGRTLSFTTPNRQFQFEYYASDVLSINGNVRDLSFSFAPSADIANFTLELQQPSTAQAFTSDPPPSDTQARQDGLVYAFYELGSLSAGEVRSLQVSYTRSTDELSVNTLGGVSIPTSAEQAPVEVGRGGLKDSLGPILIAAGVLLFTGAIFYWFWGQRGVVIPEPASRRQAERQPRPSRTKKVRPSRSPRPPVADETLAPYCHRCGTKLRGDARFCHACGAERRTG